MTQSNYCSLKNLMAIISSIIFSWPEQALGVKNAILFSNPFSGRKKKKKGFYWKTVPVHLHPAVVFDAVVMNFIDC